MNVLFQALRQGARIPAFATEGSAGADLFACLDEDMTIAVGSFSLVPTGFALSLPSGYLAEIRPRSGLAAKRGVTVLNSPGTIDSDYRGEVKVLLINHGSEPFVIHDGDRIAQMVITRHESVSFRLVDSLDGTKRGSGGFGSTGV